MRHGNGRVQYGLVAKLSSRWHALTPDHGKGVHKGNELRCCPMSPIDVANSLRFAGNEETSIDFMAFYDTPEEAQLLCDALASLGLKKDLPVPSKNPILRVGRGAHCDLVICVERDPAFSTPSCRALTRKMDPQRPEFGFHGFMIPQ